jgi:hypothetical protein
VAFDVIYIVDGRAYFGKWSAQQQQRQRGDGGGSAVAEAAVRQQGGGSALAAVVTAARWRRPVWQLGGSLAAARGHWR